MKTVTIFFMFVFISLTSVHGDNLCDIESEDCITRAAQYIFKTILHGATSLVGPINPMTIKNFGFQISDFKYKVTNATFSGLESCVPKEKLNTKESTYDYELRCSQLVLSAYVEAKGNLGPIYVDGSDLVTIIADQYVVSIKGYYGIFINKDDNSERFYLKNVIETNTKPQGKIIFNSRNSFGLPKLQAVLADTYFKSNWRSLEKMFKYPIIIEFVSELLHAIDIFIRATPISGILPKY